MKAVVRFMKVVKILKVSFFCIGLLLLCGAGFWTYTTQNFIQTASSAPGIITDMVLSRSSGGTSSSSNSSYIYKPEVRFQTESNQEITFLSTSGSNPPSYAIGDHVEVLYTPSSPHDAKINDLVSLWLGPIILTALGFIFSAIGLGFYIYDYRKAALIKHLLRHGRPIEAKIDEVVRNKRLRVNNRNPFQIIAQWQDPVSGKIFVFKSDNIWFDPSQHISQDSVTVFVEKTNPRKHYMDLSFLPERD